MNRTSVFFQKLNEIIYSGSSELTGKKPCKKQYTLENCHSAFQGVLRIVFDLE